jgi:hypothetical protein
LMLLPTSPHILRIHSSAHAHAHAVLADTVATLTRLDPESYHTPLPLAHCSWKYQPPAASSMCATGALAGTKYSEASRERPYQYSTALAREAVSEPTASVIGCYLFLVSTWKFTMTRRVL